MCFSFYWYNSEYPIPIGVASCLHPDLGVLPIWKEVQNYMWGVDCLFLEMQGIYDYTAETLIKRQTTPQQEPVCKNAYRTFKDNYKNCYNVQGLNCRPALDSLFEVCLINADETQEVHHKSVPEVLITSTRRGSCYAIPKTPAQMLNFYIDYDRYTEYYVFLALLRLSYAGVSN